MQISLSKIQFLLVMLALLTAEVISTHSLVKRRITGDKLYGLFNRSTCVSVESQDACPVSWTLPPVYAIAYKGQIKALPLLDKVLDNIGANTRCKETFRKVQCAYFAPKCLPDGAKDFGNARTLCREIYTSTSCPSILVNAYRNQQFCENNPTGKYEKADCVAPDGYISGACPQPKYKMPADLLMFFKRRSPQKAVLFQTLENARYNNGKRVLSTQCLKLIKYFSCFPLYCSKDEETLVGEHDYEDCRETETCWRTFIEASPKNKVYNQTDWNDVCREFPRRGTAKLEAIPLQSTVSAQATSTVSQATSTVSQATSTVSQATSTVSAQTTSTANGNNVKSQFSKILFLFVAVYVGCHALL